ncbi:MAG: hypothetical protein WB764_25530 [Xanthobacteraceae bacterium]
MLAKDRIKTGLGVASALLLLSSTIASAECSFGKLCGNTVLAMFNPTKFCVNGNCDRIALFNGINTLYFPSDGTVMVQFGSWWSLPGITFDTFVCRHNSAKTVSRSCKGIECRPDTVSTELSIVNMVDACSFDGDSTKLTVVLTKKDHQAPAHPGFAWSYSVDATLRIETTISTTADAAKTCDGNIQSIAQFIVSPKRPPDIVDQKYEYYGAARTPSGGPICEIYPGNGLNQGAGPLRGKVIDPGP